MFQLSGVYYKPTLTRKELIGPGWKFMLLWIGLPPPFAWHFKGVAIGFYRDSSGFVRVIGF